MMIHHQNIIREVHKVEKKSEIKFNSTKIWSYDKIIIFYGYGVTAKYIALKI